MNNWLKIGHDWLLPRRCLLCLAAADTIDLCRGCGDDLPRIESPCRGCGTPLTSGRRCGLCLKSPPPFHRVRIPYLYAGPVTTLIHALKFRQQLAAASVLGTLLAEHVQTFTARPPQCILPVPLHPARQRQRGFNQSLEVARLLGSRLNLPVMPRVARRNRPTEAQSSLQSADSRRRNLSGAFTVETKVLGPMRHVAIVDDVVTTGATVNALALALRKAGVARIELWSIARAATRARDQ